MDIRTPRAKFKALAPWLNERSRRLRSATEARALGRGGITMVARATRLSAQTIARGIRELESGEAMGPGRVRKSGGGGKQAVAKDPTLMVDLEGLVEPTASGDPESALRWTSKSVRKLAAELHAMGHAVSYPLVAELLHEAGYSLQANRKRVKVRTIRTGTHSSATSMGRSGGSRQAGSR